MDIAAAVAVLLCLIVGPVVVVNRDLLFNRSAAKRRPPEEPLPFLIIPTSPGASDIVPARVAQRRAYGPAAPAAQEWPQEEPQEQPREEPQIRAQRPQRLEDRWAQSFGAENESEDPAPDATIVFNRPVDEPLQILPGRLHVLTGEGSGEDLRLFSRLGEQPQIVVGRDTGPPHRHITLRSPTVSRRHARMDFANGHWTITNLSETNPVLVNDRVLQNGGSARRLADGDRIELGEVALRFQAI